MKRDRFLRLLEELQAEEVQINTTKGIEYAGPDDALLNFKEAAKYLGVSPLLIALVYMHKHFKALTTYVYFGKTLSNEDIKSRVCDLRLYTALFYALAVEERRGKWYAYFGVEGFLSIVRRIRRWLQI